MTRAALAAAHGIDAALIEIKVIKTTGDQIQDRPLAEIGGKGLFTKEIEEALLAGAIDLAVHSLKDMATVLPDDLCIAACLPRADARDALVSEVADTVVSLPAGALVGTASLRRAAQALALRPDLQVVPMRGAVGTRLQKLRAGQVQATFLAMAGIERMGITDAPLVALDPAIMLPAVAQGAIAIEARR